MHNWYYMGNPGYQQLRFLQMGLFDILLIIATLIFPMLVLLLWKRTYLAYPVSVLSFWFLLIAHPASYFYDPEKDNHLGFVMSLLFGWFPALFYCGFLAVLVPKVRSLMTGMIISKLAWVTSARRPFLLTMGATAALFVFLVVDFSARYIFWIFIPAPLIHGAFIVLSLYACFRLFTSARRKQSHWLRVMSLGGASIPVLLLVLMLVSSFLKVDLLGGRNPYQPESFVSPSGKYVASVPAERSKQKHTLFGSGMPFWHVTISDRHGRILYRDPDESFDAVNAVYMTWDDHDRVWLYNSGNKKVFFWETVNAGWVRRTWGIERMGCIDRQIEPPLSLFARSASSGPVWNLGTPWYPSGRVYGTARVTSIIFSHIETSESMWVGVGDKESGVEVLEADIEKQEAVIRIGSKKYVYYMTRSSEPLRPLSP